MNAHAAVNAEEEGLTLYNATLKAAARVLGFPSRMLARIRRLDDILNRDSVTQPGVYNARYARTQGTRRGEDPSIGLDMEPVPGPLGFLTSWYFFGLFVMALVLNRIQNIVVPPRNPLSMRLHAARNHGNRWSMMRIFFAYLFPVDLSSTFSRTIFRIPSIYLLAKALVIWSVLLLQTAHLFPSLAWSQAINDWVSHKQMEDICWFTFTSTCVALAVGALTNGLEGLHVNHNAPFNLFSFAFHLHIYASPSTHADKVPGGPSRPSKHIIITILIPLLQLTLLHCLEVKKQWARMRLLPTSLCSFLNLAHFHSVIWTSPQSYPLTNFFPCVVESMLCFVVFLSLSLNVLTQLLLEGAVTRPLFGHVETLMPKMDEDFGVVLIRLSTASLEVTSAAGLGNEVGGVTSTNLAKHMRTQDQGMLEIDRAGVVSIAPAFDRRGRKRLRKRGFANEIGNVKPKMQRADSWADAMVNIQWLKALGTFFLTVVKVSIQLSKRVWAIVRNKGRSRDSHIQEAGQNPPADENEDEDVMDDAEVFRRFLHGETFSDDDDDFEPTQSTTQDIEQESGSTPSEDGDDADDADGEAVQLYADLSQEAATSASAPLLLAHMTSDSPLTRRRYRKLVSEPRREESADEWDEFVSERRHVKALMKEDESSESRRNCVICTVEPRDIICWPCRCLALCNDCRENLASRSSASKHTCPCCRRSVEGYSKIYIP